MTFSFLTLIFIRLKKVRTSPAVVIYFFSLPCRWLSWHSGLASWFDGLHCWFSGLSRLGAGFVIFTTVLAFGQLTV